MSDKFQVGQRLAREAILCICRKPECVCISKELQRDAKQRGVEIITSPPATPKTHGSAEDR